MPYITDPSTFGLANDYLNGLARTTLGCAEEYEVFIVDRYLNAQLVRLPWSSIEWGRTLSDFSEASVLVPEADGGLSCCHEIGGLVPWRYGLQIQRNARQVWVGPVVLISRGAGERDVVVTARDVMSWTTKRVQPVDRLDVDRVPEQKYARNILYQIIVDAFTVDDVPLENVQLVLAGVGEALTRNFRANRLQRSYELIQEICRNGDVDYTVVNDKLFIGNMTSIATPVGTLVDEAFAELPAVAIDGVAQTNTVFVTGGRATDDGFTYWGYHSSVDPLDGVIQEVWVEPENSREEADQSQLDASALSQWTARHISPPTISEASLSPSAALPFEVLIPGAPIVVDAIDSCLWGRATTMRLTEVSVSVEASEDGVSEDVRVTLQMDLEDA